MNKIDLKEIFGVTWGFIGLPFPEMIIRGFPVRRKGDFRGEEFTYPEPVQQAVISEKGVAYWGANMQGRRMFMPIWLSAVDNNALAYLLPNTMMSLSVRANIVTTRLVNRHGTVKEEISDDDWEIRIKGVLIGEGNNYPEEEMQRLVDWRNQRQAFNIQNVKTTICLGDNEKVVIDRLHFPENRGYQNTQPYEMDLLSDKEFSLYID